MRANIATDRSTFNSFGCGHSVIPHAWPNQLTSGTNNAIFSPGMQNSLRVLIVGVLWALVAPLISGHEINLPKSPPLYGYGLVNAFPGVKFAQPVGIASPPGDTNSVYIVEQLGRIMVIPDLNNPEPKVFLDLLIKSAIRSPSFNVTHRIPPWRTRRVKN
jgi:hypothetical protein